jgi:hypothetical protein
VLTGVAAPVRFPCGAGGRAGAKPGSGCSPFPSLLFFSYWAARGLTRRGIGLAAVPEGNVGAERRRPRGGDEAGAGRLG